MEWHTPVLCPSSSSSLESSFYKKKKNWFRINWGKENQFSENIYCFRTYGVKMVRKHFLLTYKVAYAFSAHDWKNLLFISSLLLLIFVLFFIIKSTQKEKERGNRTYPACVAFSKLIRSNSEWFGYLLYQ